MVRNFAEPDPDSNRTYLSHQLLLSFFITTINIIIIWTLGVVWNPGTRSGSRGEAVIKTISFNSAAGRSQETGHATCGML